MKLNLIINHTSMEPIYEQIIAQIKAEVIEGRMTAGDALPSVRTLSRELKISALTVKKAYDNLEEEGLIVTVHGKGSFIAAANQELLMEERRKELEKELEAAVQKALKHESHFDQVVDPAGGSYYIENLTDSIANEAWKLFREIEEKGGYTAAYESGFIVERVKASAAAKDKNIATRREILLGANQYPNFTEVAGKELTEAAVTRPVSEGNTLAPYRGSMAFEAMRLHVDRSGKAPKAFMLTCGSLAMARARAQFSCNFFACAGIKVIDNTFFKSIEEGVKAALESKAEIVVVCASDDDYAEAAPKVKELLGDKAILVVAGAPACMPELEAQGIKNFINVKSNVLETLKFYLKEMGI